MRKAWRHIRLFIHFVSFSFSRAFEFRFDFWMRILMDVMFYGVAISFFKIIFLHTPTLGGWTEPQMMIFVSAYCMVDAINMTLFSNNIWQMPMMINRGDLDYYLLRPVSSLFFLSLRDFAANSFVNLIMTFGIFGWALARYPVHVSLAKIALFLLMLLNGNVIFYCIQMLAMIPVFYTHANQGFNGVVWSLTKFGERPDRIYTGFIRRLLTTVVPMAIISSFPTRLLIEDFSWTIFLQCFAISIAFVSIVIYFWNRALRSYSSASS